MTVQKRIWTWVTMNALLTKIYLKTAMLLPAESTGMYCRMNVTDIITAVQCKLSLILQMKLKIALHWEKKMLTLPLLKLAVQWAILKVSRFWRQSVNSALKWAEETAYLFMLHWFLIWQLPVNKKQNQHSTA